MKKLMILSLAAFLCAPVFAKEHRACKEGACPLREPGKAAMKEPGFHKMKQEGRSDAFKKARKEHKAKMKATEEKAEKLVEQYKKMKPGKKKDAKKAEISALVSSIRDEQLKFKEDQLVKFQERLSHMQAALEKDKSAEAKKDWVERKTDLLIAEDGDLEDLFEHDGPAKRPLGPKGKMHPQFKRGPEMGNGAPSFPEPVEKPAK